MSTLTVSGCPGSRWSFPIGFAVVALLTGFFVIAPVHADELKETTSLRAVPADVSVYLSMLRNREQVEIFLGSNAYQRIKAVPLVNFGLTMLEGQWQNSDNEVVQIARDLWEQEENQALAQVLLDAVSHEVFFLADGKLADVLARTQQIQRDIRALQMKAAKDGESDEVTEEALGKLLLERLDGMPVPLTVAGFRLSDPQAALAQLERLEKLVREGLENEEDLAPLRERFRREQIADGTFLTLSLSGDMIPWDEVPEGSPLREEKVKEFVSRLKLAVSLGIKGNYLLLSIGPSHEHLQHIGEGDLLIDRPEFAPLRKHADRKITSIGYVSKAFLEQANSQASQLDDLVNLAETFLPQAELGEETTAELLGDVKAFATEVKEFLPRPGAMLAFSFLTDQGFESYVHDWSENQRFDGSKPLTLLDHVGGETIGFTVARGQYQPEGYDWLVKWLKKGWHHAEKIGVPKMSDEEREKFSQVKEHALPLLERFDKTTRENLIPALKDSQAGLVLDAKAKSKQWHEALPSTRVALPMLEIGLVCGVSDPVALKKAGADYFAILQDALDLAHELDPDKVPEVKLPAPKVEQTDAGEVYSYPVAEELGLDPQFSPNLGLSKNVLAFSLFPAHTNRMLTATPPRRIGPLSEADKPLVSASYFRIDGLVDAMVPWVNFAVRLVGRGEDGEDNQQLRVGAQMVAGNVTPILEVLKCIGERASVSYIEDGALVTHAVTVIVDTP